MASGWNLWVCLQCIGVASGWNVNINVKRQSDLIPYQHSRSFKKSRSYEYKNYFARAESRDFHVRYE